MRRDVVERLCEGVVLPDRPQPRRRGARLRHALHSVQRCRRPPQEAHRKPARRPRRDPLPAPRNGRRQVPRQGGAGPFVLPQAEAFVRAGQERNVARVRRRPQGGREDGLHRAPRLQGEGRRHAAGVPGVFLVAGRARAGHQRRGLQQGLPRFRQAPLRRAFPDGAAPHCAAPRHAGHRAQRGDRRDVRGGARLHADTARARHVAWPVEQARPAAAEDREGGGRSARATSSSSTATARSRRGAGGAARAWARWRWTTSSRSRRPRPCG